MLHFVQASVDTPEEKKIEQNNEAKKEELRQGTCLSTEEIDKGFSSQLFSFGNSAAIVFVLNKVNFVIGQFRLLQVSRQDGTACQSITHEAFRGDAVLVVFLKMGAAHDNDISVTE